MEGARRVGKTCAVRAFAEEAYRSHLFLDFSDGSQKIRDLFEGGLQDLDSFFRVLEAATGARLYERESVIVFDEVQMCPRARGAIKYLVADGRYDYVETGSLISLPQNVRNILIPSEETRIRMYPLDFQEFLWAREQTSLYEALDSAYVAGAEGIAPLHRRSTDLFREYLLVGGMPEAVGAFLKTNSFLSAEAAKQRILDLYRADLRAVGGRSGFRAEDLFDSLPAQLSRPRKQFSPSLTRKNGRARDFTGAITLLRDAMLINPCFRAADPATGLKLRSAGREFKPYMVDTGLLVTHAFGSGGRISEKPFARLLPSALELCEGMLAENVAAQMLTAAGNTLYYYLSPDRGNAEDRAEADFLIGKGDVAAERNLLAIEAESGGRRRPTSLLRFEAKFSRQVDRSFVARDGVLEEKNDATYVPYYLIPWLARGVAPGARPRRL